MHYFMLYCVTFCDFVLLYYVSLDQVSIFVFIIIILFLFSFCHFYFTFRNAVGICSICIVLFHKCVLNCTFHGKSFEPKCQDWISILVFWLDFRIYPSTHVFGSLVLLPFLTNFTTCSLGLSKEQTVVCSKILWSMCYREAYFEPAQSSERDLFEKIVNSSRSLTTFAEISVQDVSLSS